MPMCRLIFGISNHSIISCMPNRTLPAGVDRLFVETRADGDEEQPGIWGYYTIADIPALLQWLESGSSQEQELAEDLFAAYQPQLQAVMLAEKASVSFTDLAGLSFIRVMSSVSVTMSTVQPRKSCHASG